MSTLVLLASGETVIGRRAGLRDRLIAWLRAGSLDRQLARGVAPETGGPLTLRARALIGPSARSSLARQLRRVVSDARGDHVWLTRIPVRRREVLAAADALDPSTCVASRRCASCSATAAGRCTSAARPTSCTPASRRR
jgi:hypothetical protein